MTSPSLPALAPYPTTWRDLIVPEEWVACLDAWIALTGAYLSLSRPDFARASKDASLPVFLKTYVAETAQSPSPEHLTKTIQLRKLCYLLANRVLDLEHPPESLLHWDFLSDFCRIYGSKNGRRFTSLVWNRHLSSLERSLAALKSSLIKELEAGLHGDLKLVEFNLSRLNHLLHASPKAAAFFMAGSDFVDSLIQCYKIMNPPLRKVIVSTLYLCLIGLTEGESPNFSSLVDHLYSLKVAAGIHKAGPTHVNDSLVAELVTDTPVLKQVQQRIDASESGSVRAKSVLTSLADFKKPTNVRPVRLSKRKVNKGKGITTKSLSHGDVYIHRMSFISQVQDLFPDLGSGFIVKLLDEYHDNVEQVVGHLLEGSLPSHLESADRSEEMDASHQFIPDIASRSTPPLMTIRHNVFDDDEFDKLAVDTSRLHFGRRDPDSTADDVLRDRSNAPSKAAILSALATFDSDDDERDDTYDVEDVGGTVDSATPGNNPEEANADVRDAYEEALFKAYKATPDIFGRDTATRKGKPRLTLKEETGMTDEAIEGWGLMLSRDPRQMRRLEAKFSHFSGAQRGLSPTAWRAGSGNEDSENANDRGRGGRLRGAPRGGGRGRGRGNVTGPTGDKETEVARNRKEANKGSRANHNRRDQRARKMARAGFAG
ncbi:CUE domain-containing protein [Diplocarpon rosae]|nr:CUE domain-containing protein [Diplocarpon rosae]